MREISKQFIMENSTEDAATGCWRWSRYVGVYGYGVVASDLFSHRAAYMAFKGPIPNDCVIDHLCRVKDCVNPYHLEAVSRVENSRRGVPRNKNKTHCSRGHPYDEANTYVRPNGGRDCKKCRRIYVKKALSKLPDMRQPPGERTHCPYGHPYSGDNLILHPLGGRACRECKRRRDREHYQKLKLASTA